MASANDSDVDRFAGIGDLFGFGDTFLLHDDDQNYDAVFEFAGDNLSASLPNENQACPREAFMPPRSVHAPAKRSASNGQT